MAAEVINALMTFPEDQLEEFLSACAGLLNPELFHYCCSMALLHRFRHYLSNVTLRRLAETFPSKFLNSEVIAQVGEEAAIVAQEDARTPITIPRDVTSESEDRLAYFREDIGVNSHHWHWHLVFPFTASNRAIVAKDRRGELFFYMHQQVLARDVDLSRGLDFSNRGPVYARFTHLNHRPFRYVKGGIRDPARKIQVRVRPTSGDTKKGGKFKISLAANTKCIATGYVLVM